MTTKLSYCSVNTQQRQQYLTLSGKHPEADSSDGFPIFDESQILVLGIEHQAGDVLLWHPAHINK
jgi:hypothetical protein